VAAATNRPCGNRECTASTGLHDDLSFGSGYLDFSGYFEKPCATCARAWEVHDGKCIGTYAPFPAEAEAWERGMDWKRGITDECHACWTRSNDALPEELASATGTLSVKEWFFLGCPSCGTSWVVTHLEDGRVTGKFRRGDRVRYAELGSVSRSAGQLEPAIPG
jgi:hypothetical protein